MAAERSLWRPRSCLIPAALPAGFRAPKAAQSANAHYIVAMAHKNGMVPRKRGSRGTRANESKGAKQSGKGMSEAGAKFRDAADAATPAPKGDAYDPAPPAPTTAEFDLPMHGGT